MFVNDKLNFKYTILSRSKQIYHLTEIIFSYNIASDFNKMM